MIPALNVQWWRVWCGRALVVGIQKRGTQPKLVEGEPLGKASRGDAKSLVPKADLGKGHSKDKGVEQDPALGHGCGREALAGTQAGL